MEEIKNKEDLFSMDEKGEYVLINDIDCGDEKIKCILKNFKGKIDGAGHSIKNIVISDIIWGDEQTVALFYNMTRATINNIIFDGIKLEYDDGFYTPRVAVIGGKCSDCKFSDIRVTAFNPSEDKTPMFYDLNNCVNINNIIKCNKKVSVTAKYEE